MSVETAVALFADRHIPPALLAEQAKALAATDAVDGVLLPDQLASFLPRQMWTTDNTPMAGLIGDPDSFADVFALAAYMLAVAPELQMTVATDSIRRAPAELMQTMLTLASMAGGEARFHIGGGEAKQCKPFGHKRSQGISRMEDLFKLIGLFLEHRGEPFDYDGKRWTFRKASIGGAMPHRPKFYGLGGGPMLIDHTTSYADGLSVCCPSVWASAELFAEQRERILKMVEEKGRDPEQFAFQLWFPGLLTDDENQLDQAMDNPLVRWMSSFFGRVETRLWADSGLENPLGDDDWVYYRYLLPYDTPQALVDQVLANTTRKHVEESWMYGTSAEAAQMVQPYIDAGADWVCAMDFAPLVMEAEAAQQSFARNIAFCAAVKEYASAPAA